jgi:hypothetical protein
MATDYLVPWINSAGGDGSRNSMTVLLGDGATQNWSFNFSGGYINKTDVKAYTYEPTQAVFTAIDLTDPAKWLGPSQIKLAPAVASGTYLVIYRDTDKTQPLVNFATNSVLNEVNLDMMAEQAVFATAEMADRFNAVNASASDATTRSVQAFNTANTALADAQAAQGAAAAAISTANAANSTAGAANTTAGAAVTTANTAKSTADGLAASIATANTNASNAVSTANGINAKAQSALDTAGAASSTASAASTTANTAKSTADGLAASIATANTNASAAVSTANAAAAAVGQFSGRNRIINGDARIDQYGSKTYPAGLSGTGGVDRFFASVATSAGSITQSRGSVTVNGTSKFTVRQTVNTAAVITGTNFLFGISQKIEGFNVLDLVNNAFCVSFLFNSNVTGVHSFAVRDSTGSNAYVSSFSYSTANTPQRVVIALPAYAWTVVSSAGIGLHVLIDALNTGAYQTSTLNQWGTAGPISAAGAVNWAATAGNFIEVTDLQLEAGTVATAFERRLYGPELALCQRYYQVVSLWTAIAVNTALSTSGCTLSFTPMRALPTQSLSLTYQGSASAGTVNSWQGVSIQNATLVFNAQSTAGSAFGTVALSSEI